MAARYDLIIVEKFSHKGQQRHKAPRVPVTKFRCQCIKLMHCHSGFPAFQSV